MTSCTVDRTLTPCFGAVDTASQSFSTSVLTASPILVCCAAGPFYILVPQILDGTFEAFVNALKPCNWPEAFNGSYDYSKIASISVARQYASTKFRVSFA